MQLRIDLLGRRKRLSVTELEFVHKLRLVTGIILAIYIICLAALLGYRFYLSHQSDLLDQKIKQQENLIAKKLPLESRYVLIARKLGLIKSFFDTRATKREVLDFFYNLAPVGVTLTDVSFAGGKEEEFNLSGEAESVFSFATFIDTLDSAVEQEVFIAVDLDSVRRDLAGTYKFSLTIILDTAQFTASTKTKES